MRHPVHCSDISPHFKMDTEGKWIFVFVYKTCVGDPAYESYAGRVHDGPITDKTICKFPTNFQEQAPLYLVLRGRDYESSMVLEFGLDGRFFVSSPVTPNLTLMSLSRLSATCF